MKINNLGKRSARTTFEQVFQQSNTLVWRRLLLRCIWKASLLRVIILCGNDYPLCTVFIDYIRI